MILDTIENAEKYYKINPYFKKAFEFLKTADPSNAGVTVEIDGEKVYAMIIKSVGEGREGAQLEIHKKYIDIQYCVEGLHVFGWKPTRECSDVTREFDDADDYGFFGEEPDFWAPVKPGQFAIFFPEDAHTPKGGKGPLHKILVKVAID